MRGIIYTGDRTARSWFSLYKRILARWDRRRSCKRLSSVRPKGYWNQPTGGPDHSGEYWVYNSCCKSPHNWGHWCMSMTRTYSSTSWCINLDTIIPCGNVSIAYGNDTWRQQEYVQLSTQPILYIYLKDATEYDIYLTHSRTVSRLW